MIYTDSSKVLVRALGRHAIFDLAARRGYWDGEDTGLPNGEIPPSSAHEVEWRDEGPPGSTRFGGRSKHLTEAAVGSNYHVGMLIEAPAPLMRLAPKHYHMLEEEHAFMLEGQVTLLLGDERYEMKAGDYVCFPAGRKVGHSFMNSGAGPCSCLMIGENNPNDVCVLPDSNKMEVPALRTKGAIFDMSGVKKYWDGEQTS